MTRFAEWMVSVGVEQSIDPTSVAVPHRCAPADVERALACTTSTWRAVSSPRLASSFGTSDGSRST